MNYLVILIHLGNYLYLIYDFLIRIICFFSPRVTFPLSNTMQVDFSSRHTNTIIDDGRVPSKLISNYDTTHQTPPRFAQERSSTEYTSTRKVSGSSGVGGIGGIGGIGGGVSSSFERSSSKIHFFHHSLLLKKYFF
jgi:hypothetical protein